MNNELIEKLKKNERPFGLLTEEEKDVLQKMNDIGLLWMYNGGNQWIEIRARECIRWVSTYRISPDYQPVEEGYKIDIPFTGQILSGSLGITLTAEQMKQLQEERGIEL